MYLAKTRDGDSFSYELRSSYKSRENQFTYKIIYDLGPEPENHFEIFEDHIILFKDQLLAEVANQEEGDAELILEKLLWNFLPRETRRRLSRFHNRDNATRGKLTEDQKESILRQIHLFDRRRLYYLRYGAVDQSRLTQLHEKCCLPLLHMSRDEKEYFFRTEETSLEPGMYLQYIYAIFNLQKFYSESFAPWFPESLSRQGLEEYLVEEICHLNASKSFWTGEDCQSFLHHHLQRYLIMFFDYTPSSRSFIEDFARSFMDSHRKFRWPERQPEASPEKIADIFGTSYSELRNMTKEQLTKQYRQKAMLLHPDRGGDHEQFIQLTEIYNALLVQKCSSVNP